MLEQTLKHLPLVIVNGMNRRAHQHDAEGVLFMPYQYTSALPMDHGAEVIAWQVFRPTCDFNHKDFAFVRFGKWPDVQYYVRLDCFQDHGEYIEQCIHADVDMLTQAEWLDTLKVIQATYR